MKRLFKAIGICLVVALGFSGITNAEVSFSTSSIPLMANPLDIEAVDFNNDGKTDIVVVLPLNPYQEDGMLGIALGKGDGTFAPLSYLRTGRYPWFLATDDLNEDGNIDMVVTNAWGGSFCLFIGDGKGAFSRKDITIGNRGIWEGPVEIAISDYNNDGHKDLAITQTDWGRNSIYVALGDGKGNFTPNGFLDAGYGPYAIKAADLNKDGSMDLVVGHWGWYKSIPYVTILFGKGDGTFLPRVDYQVGLQTYPEIFDINKDGFLDIVVSNHASEFMSFIFGNERGSFTRTDIEPVSRGYYPSRIVDVDGDKNEDLVVTNGKNGYISIFRGNGTGKFSPSTNFSIGLGDESYLLANDFNGDGKIDFAISDDYSKTITILINTSVLPNQPPIADAGADLTIEFAGSTGNSVTLNGSGSSDPDGDMLTYTWTWAGGSIEGINPTVKLPLGTTVITLIVNDGKATATDTVTIVVRDTMPPMTTSVIGGTHGNNGWHVSDVTIGLSAEDPGAGVREIHYQIDGGSRQTISGNSGYVVLSNDGIHTITYWAVDNAGNVENGHSLSVKIDKTRPLITVISPTSGNYLISDVLTVNFAVADGISGVVSSTSHLDTQNIANGQAVHLYQLTPGDHVFTVEAVDGAGNISASIVNFNIIVTTGSLSDLIGYFLSIGQIDNQGIANSLIQKLNNNAYGAFKNFLSAQAGDHISSEAAAILRTAIGALKGK